VVRWEAVGEAGRLSRLCWVSQRWVLELILRIAAGRTSHQRRVFGEGPKLTACFPFVENSLSMTPLRFPYINLTLSRNRVTNGSA
jgi:hypothetical protein